MNKPTFRAWDKKDKVMRGIQHLVWSKDNLIAHCQPRGHEFSEWFTVVLNGWEYQLMQSTGLKDKNGVEIFEGDVVNLDVCNGFDNVNGKCVVQHSTGHSGLVCCHIRSGVEYRIFNNNFNYGYEYKVLGSIHENPELLNEVK